MNILPYNPEYKDEFINFKVSAKATELIKKFHQSADGLTLKNWKALSEILDYAAAAEQTIADQKQVISDLEELAATDMLTGLLNRQGLEQEITHAIARAQRYDEKSLFSFIDLNDFKQINDTYGHNAGDAMLKQVGEILADSIRLTDASARISGDEFGLLLTSCDIGKAKERAGFIRHSLRKISLKYEGQSFHTSASMGFAVIDEQSKLSEVFKIADQAMYQNKRQRRKTKNKYHMS